MSRDLTAVDQAVTTLRRCLPFVQSGMQFTNDAALGLLESQSDDAEKLKEFMLEFCRIERDVEQFSEAAKHVLSQAKGTREAIDLEGLLNSELADIQSDNNDASLRHNVKFTELVERITGAAQAAEENSMDMSAHEIQLDDDLAMTQTTVNTKCPVTMMEMKNPVRNKYCKHIYDLDGAKQLIKNRPLTRCPVGGCINDKPLRLEDLEEDKKMKRYIEQQHRKAAQKTAKH